MKQQIDLAGIAKGLTFDSAQGVWSSQEFHKVSFAEEGHDFCFNIEDSSFWFRHRNRVIQYTVATYPPHMRVLFDIGGGNGYVSSALSSQNLSTVLLEPGAKGIINARTRGLKNLIHSDFDSAKFCPASLPSVGLFDVLEHIENDLDFLKTLRHTIMPDGMLYLTVPAYSLLWSHEDEVAGHFRRYRLKVLEKLVIEAGFEIVYSSYFFSILPIPIFLFRTLPARFSRTKLVTRVPETEHIGGSGLFVKILNWLLRGEMQLLNYGVRLPFGGSCVVAARARAK